ncbi:MAG: tetratricopeptide repeat protein [Acidobacteriota bacterium]|nr:tetratricopeptide repeat protein [Acidobacteriota bacterium]
MKRVFQLVLVVASCCATPALLYPQAPATGDASGSSQSQPSDAQKPGAPQASNPFPEDTSSVPVLPTSSSPAAPAPAFDAAEDGSIHLPHVDSDPVRSPDDPASDAEAGQSDGFSSSQQGIDNLIQPPPDEGKRDKKRKDGELEEPLPHAGAKEDINVGTYYLESSNWQGALSRFESALVLAPDNPDVYWGLGEAERHLGNYPAAKAYYQKLIEYDPDSHHGKEARKILKQPEMVNATASQQPH